MISGQWLVAKEGGGRWPGQTTKDQGLAGARPSRISQARSNQPSPAARRRTKATVPNSSREDGTLLAVEPAGYGLASPVKPGQI